MIAAGIYRPAAIDQLKTLVSRSNVPVFSLLEVPAVEIVRQGLEQAKANHTMTMPWWYSRSSANRWKTHGRVAWCQSTCWAEWNLLVVDALIGQKRLMWRVSLTNNSSRGHLDQDWWGYPWWCSPFCPSDYWKPIKFTGFGEKITDIETFHRIMGWILSMGICWRWSKASQKNTMRNVPWTRWEMQENTFDFNDFIDQLDQVQT